MADNQNMNLEETNSAETALENKATNVCSKCGAELAEGQEFCSKCGTPRRNKFVCSKCGAELAEGQGFCPKCGQKVGLAVDAGVASKIDLFNAGVSQKKSKKKKMPIIIAVVAVVAIVVVAVVLKGGIKTSKGPDFQSLYDEYCSSTWADVGSDNSYLMLDTNPYDEDDNGVSYIEAYYAAEDINKALGLPDSLFAEFGEVTGADGKQTEDFPDQRVTVSWKYHPDKGLEITYKTLKSN